MAKRKLQTSDDWFRWSDGRAFTKNERRKMGHILRRVRQPGESFKQRFFRVRATIEEFEEQKARIVARRPNIFRRIWSYLTGERERVIFEARNT